VADHDLGARLKAYAEAWEHAAGGPPAAELRRRGRRRARRRAGLVVAAVAAAASLLAAGGLPSWAPGWGGDRADVPVLRPAGRLAGEPATFLGATDTGRVALYDTATGRPLRYLTPTLVGTPVLDAAHGTVWYADYASACGDAWHQVDVASGRTRPFLPGERFVETMALSPDGRQLAFSRTDAKASNEDGRPHVACRNGQLVVVDLQTKTRRQWTLRRASAIELRWSPDGTQLSIRLNPRDLGGAPTAAEDYLLDLSAPGSPQPTRLVGPQGPGCLVLAPEFVPGTEEVLVGSSCDGAQPELLRFDRHSGRLLGRVELDSGRDSRLELERVAVDASGRHVLLSVLQRGSGNPAGEIGEIGEIRVLRGDRTVVVTRGASLADW
jgi:WD40-like Beta Propeller Repeat